MLDVRRHPEWRSRLGLVLRNAYGRHFEWGSADCCLGLAVPAVQAVIGVDLGAPYRGQYTTALGALKALKAQGYDSLVDLAAANFPRQSPAFARRGDLAAIKAVDTGWGLGVVIGARIGVLAPSGFATIDLLKADHGYRVG